jgi:AcrR family transcriptional regulator
MIEGKKRLLNEQLRYRIVLYKDVKLVKKQQPPKTIPEPTDEDERVRRSKQAVLTATFRLLSETGLTGVSVDAVSRLSGVAKTTIYRHWPSRSALILDACAKLRPKSELTDTGNLKGDLTALALNMADRLRTARWATILPSIMDAAERDPELAKLHAQLHAEMTIGFRTVVERAQQRGEIPRNRGVTEIVALVIGPLFYRRWLSRETIDDAFVKRVIESAIGENQFAARSRRPQR